MLCFCNHYGKVIIQYEKIYWMFQSLMQERHVHYIIMYRETVAGKNFIAINPVVSFCALTQLAGRESGIDGIQSLRFSAHLPCRFRFRSLVLSANQGLFSVAEPSVRAALCCHLLLVFCCSQQQVNDSHHLAGGSQ